MKFEFSNQETCDHALENMMKSKDTNRSGHKGTQTIAFCAPEGTEVAKGKGSVIEKLREERRGEKK